MDYAGLGYPTKTSEVTEIEICLEDLSTMYPLKTFPNLQILSLCNTKISLIDGLLTLPQLEELHLSENQISTIEGLENLARLKKLNLSNNKIQKLENLDSLVSLEWFWINENQISHIENLETLKNLTEFSIAQNQISSISRCLMLMNSVKVLNLAGNFISSFREVKKLALMENLTSLFLADPNFGESILCSLSNYSVFVLFILKNIKMLDGVLVTAELRNSSETTFLKKKLFYTMKIKSIQRAISGLKGTITEEAFKKMQENWDFILNQLKIAKKIEFEIDDRLYSRKLAHPLYTFTSNSLANNPLDSLANLNDQLHLVHSQYIQSIKDEYQKLYRFYRIFNCVVNKVHAWGGALTQEIESEFEAGGNLRFEEGSSSDSWFRSCCELVNTRQGDGMKVTVTRVSRIHNRLLRNRFEEKLESLVDLNENTYKRNIDYLFHSGPDIPDIISEGFKSPSDYSKQSQPGCIPLSYSLETAETERVRKLDQEFEDVHEIYWPKGKVLLCKVYFGKGKGDLRVPYYGENLTPKEIWELCPFNQPNICWAVYRTFEYDLKQRVWFIFDNCLVLPEYLIEFEYSTEGFGAGTRVEGCLGALNTTLNAFYSEVVQKPGTLIGNVMEIPQRNLISKVDKYNIEDFIRGDYLNLLHCSIESLDFWGKNTNLSVLVLSGNLISDLTPLAWLSELEKLDLSFNQIKNLDGLESLNKLSELDLHNNSICNLGELKKLPSSFTKFSCFLNKVYLDPRYDEVILSLFPNLIILDWRNISKNTKGQIIPKVDFSSEKIQQKVQMSPSEIPQKLETLELLSLNILSMRGLDSCYCLKKLDLSQNFLTNIESLETCESLEDLNLSHNFIESFQTLPGKLKYLDLASNKIQSLPVLSYLTNLCRLCLNQNFISNLSEIRNIGSLIELYISNNLVSDNKELLSLKQLNYLLILDCLNNPCVEPGKHRLHFLYYFNSLKVLNGANVEPAEVLAARQEYGGSLTEDLLDKRCTGIRTIDLRQLDLSGCKLRSIENMFTAELFPRLLELNISNNLFTNFCMFGYLPMVAKVDLSRNKVESFQTSSRASMPLPNVEILNMGFNVLTSLYGLPQVQLRSLRIFNISHNLINRIDLVESLSNLRELDASHNKLRVVDRKLDLPNLRSANFENNGLKNLNFLEGLLWLQAIRAQNNRISEISDVEKIQSLPNLLELSLIPNPIERKAGYRLGIIRKFPSLVFLDGKEVSDEERMDQIEIKRPVFAGIQKMNTKIASITLDAYFLKIHPRTAGTLTRKN